MAPMTLTLLHPVHTLSAQTFVLAYAFLFLLSMPSSRASIVNHVHLKTKSEKGTDEMRTIVSKVLKISLDIAAIWFYK